MLRSIDKNETNEISGYSSSIVRHYLITGVPHDHNSDYRSEPNSRLTLDSNVCSY